MQFNSYEFLYFFPMVLILYYLGNKINPVIGKIIIIISSIFFYSWGRLNMLVYLLISIVINYVISYLIQKNNKARMFVLVSVILNVGALVIIKYTNFVFENIYSLFDKEFVKYNIVLPLGISFYTFQQIAYVVSVYKKDVSNINIIDYLSYILYFPKLLMGPLMEPQNFIEQINDVNRKYINADNIAFGLKIFSFGLLKKALFADTFSKAVTWVNSSIETATAMDCFLLMIFYTFEIYFDFSGYCDMAVGCSKMLNIDLPINFDSPYKAVSIRDFWKRWHISLTKFFTKYVYIPLGGSRKGNVRTYVNTMVVFLISGLWHGANWTFVLWGILHGALSCLERLFEKTINKVFMPVRWMISFLTVSVLWLLFSSDSIRQWLVILYRIVCNQSNAVSSGLYEVFNIPEFIILSKLPFINIISANIRGLGMIIFMLTAAVICFVPENNYRNKDKVSIMSIPLAAIAFVWGVLCLGTESSFVYFGF